MFRSLNLHTLKKIGCLLLLSLFTAQSITYYWAVDGERETRELYDPVDAESEKEETKNEKEKDHKLKEDLYALQSAAASGSVNFLPPIDLQSLSDPEITTPPPQPILPLS